MRGIINAIQRSEWSSHGIEKWNDLLRKTFGDVNKETRHIYSERKA